MSNLRLIKFGLDDFQQYFSLVSNESVMAMITERAIPYEEASENFQKIIIRNRIFEQFGTYKVLLNNEFIGLGSLKLDEESMQEAELGYMLLPNYRGMGFGGEIAEVLIQKAKCTDIKKLTAIIDPNNIPSRKILMNHGFVSEKLCEIYGLPALALQKYPQEDNGNTFYYFYV